MISAHRYFYGFRRQNRAFEGIEQRQIGVATTARDQSSPDQVASWVMEILGTFETDNGCSPSAAGTPLHAPLDLCRFIR
jgi:hypothetical protein